MRLFARSQFIRSISPPTRKHNGWQPQYIALPSHYFDRVLCLHDGLVRIVNLMHTNTLNKFNSLPSPNGHWLWVTPHAIVNAIRKQARTPTYACQKKTTTTENRTFCGRNIHCRSWADVIFASVTFFLQVCFNVSACSTCVCRSLVLLLCWQFFLYIFLRIGVFAIFPDAVF